MRASFEPNVLEIAFLVGWTAYGAVRDRFERLRARFPGAAVGDSTDAGALVHETPPARVVRTANDVTAERAPRVASTRSRRPAVDYSIN
jgi:hypothetical protein